MLRFAYWVLRLGLGKRKNINVPLFNARTWNKLSIFSNRLPLPRMSCCRAKGLQAVETKKEVINWQDLHVAKTSLLGITS